MLCHRYVIITDEFKDRDEELDTSTVIPEIPSELYALLSSRKFLRVQYTFGPSIFPACFSFGRSGTWSLQF